MRGVEGLCCDCARAVTYTGGHDYCGLSRNRITVTKDASSMCRIGFKQLTAKGRREMAKKVDRLKKLQGAKKKLSDLTTQKSNAESALNKAWAAYLQSVKDQVVEMLKGLHWKRFKGRGCKSELEAVVEEKTILADIRHLEQDLPGHRWYRLSFKDAKDAYEVIRLTFRNPSFDTSYKLVVRASIAQLKTLGIVPEVADQKRKRAVRKLVDQAGLDENEMQKALALYKEQKKTKGK